MSLIIRKYMGVVLFIVAVLLASAGAKQQESTTEQSRENVTRPTNGENEHVALNSVHNGQHSSFESERKKWKTAFAEIKSLVIIPPSVNGTSSSSKTSLKTRTNKLLNQWKLLLDGDDEDKTAARKKISRQRFDGFASWESRLQEWAEEAAEYLEKSSQFWEENTGEYPLSTFGQPSSVTKELLSTKEESLDAIVTLENATQDIIRTETYFPDAASAPVEKDEEKKSLVAVSPKPTAIRPGEPVLPHTDIADPSKRIWIVTTAALPWMTGTAVNPLLRAAYLTNGRAKAGGAVTLMLPWLERQSDQERIYGSNKLFATPEAQETFIRNWLRKTANMAEASENLNIRWYTAWENLAENSVYSMGDITALIPEDEADICVLEEPEHLNWYRAPGESWTTKFKHVVGIVHTNYFVYAQEQPAALVRAPSMRLLCSWMCRAHCHRVIKLSGTLDQFAPEKELVENVHGVRRAFLDSGLELRQTLNTPAGRLDPVFGAEATPTVYFIGKMLWSKGIGSLMELLKYAEESAGLKIKVDMYGGGPDKDAASKRAGSMGVDMLFHGPIDHVELAPSHKIFINPSTSEVLCTTVAEALAMGKFVVLPSHPSNDFFAQFPNCLPYSNKEEFVGNLYYAFTHEPEPLSEEYSYALSWEAATDRFAAAGSISVRESEAMVEAAAAADAGVEINLPSLFENEKRRKEIATTIKQTRYRFRQFRSKLSQEIQQSNVLPKNIQERLVADLEKRLDLDLDTMLESPKLRLKLSPAELDKQLLEFYNVVTKGPSGDVLRLIGGGNDVGKQNEYLKRQAKKKKNNTVHASSESASTSVNGLPLLGDSTIPDDVSSGGAPSTPTRGVKSALRRNLPLNMTPSQKSERDATRLRQQNTKRDDPQIKMTVAASLSNISPQMRYESLGGTKLLGITVRNTHAFVPAYAMSYSSFVSSPLI